MWKNVSSVRLMVDIVCRATVANGKNVVQKPNRGAHIFFCMPFGFFYYSLRFTILIRFCLGVGTVKDYVDICYHYLTLKSNRLVVDNFKFDSWWNSFMRQTQKKADYFLLLLLHRIFLAFELEIYAPPVFFLHILHLCISIYLARTEYD